MSGSGRWAREHFGAGMGRRTFLKAAGTAAVIAATGTLGCAGPGAGTASPTAAPTRAPPVATGKLIVATDPDPAQLVDRAIDAYGGLSGIIRKGDKVIVKANFSWMNTPEQGGCNQPQVLARVMQRCKEAAGDGEVTAIDNTINYGPMCLDQSGIKKAVEDVGMQAKAIVDPSDFVEQAVDGVALKSIMMPKALLDADVLVDVPAIKSHGNTLMTGAIKNLMGLVFSRSVLHNMSLDQNIADLAGLFRPNLVIADAYRVVIRNGPQGSSDPDDLTHPQQVVVGDDIVAADAFCAGYLGLEPGDVGHIRLAGEDGLGQIDLSKMNVIRV